MQNIYEKKNYLNDSPFFSHSTHARMLTHKHARIHTPTPTHTLCLLSSTQDELHHTI